MSAHASVLGGSNAARLMSCPASFQEQLRAPVADVESVYAAEGTMLHEIIADMVRRRTTSVPVPPTLTTEQSETLDKALAMLEDLKRTYGGGFRVIAIEQSATFPGLPAPSAFGTVDLVLASKSHVIIVDWKFGSGVPVKILYDDGVDDYLNAQPAFYAICARAKRRKMFRERVIVLAIVQPRLDSLSVAVTDNEELDKFEVSMTAAYTEALGRNPHRERGDHCRFATCKATCPLWTGQVLDLAVLDPAWAALQAATNRLPSTEYEAFLANALQLAEIAETWAEEIRRQGHVYLEDGGTIPGWKLVPKRATRKWIDEVNAGTDLLAIGALPEDVWTEPTLRSVKQAEDRLKKRGLSVPEDLYHSVSSGTTIAHGDDHRPETTHATVAVELRKALTAL